MFCQCCNLFLHPLGFVNQALFFLSLSDRIACVTLLIEYFFSCVIVLLYLYVLACTFHYFLAIVKLIEKFKIFVASSFNCSSRVMA